MEKVWGAPEIFVRSRISANSSSISRKSETHCKTPEPASASPWAMASISSRAAPMVGVRSPSAVRWTMVRVVEKPSAPALIASAVIARIWAASSAVAGSRFAPRSPIT